MQTTPEPTKGDDEQREVSPTANDQTPRVIQGVCPSCGGVEFRSFDVPVCGVTIDVCTTCKLHINSAGMPAKEQAEAGTYEEDFHACYEQRASGKLQHSSFRMRLIESLQPPGKLLDIGCSLGYFMEAAAERGWDAWGVDISRHAVEACQQQGLQAKVGDMQHLDFPDETFDVINLRHVLEHDWELWACLEEIRRVLKPDGLLNLEVPSVHYWKVRVFGGKYIEFWYPYHLYHFSNTSVRNIMSRAGYDRVRIPWYGRMEFSGGVGEACRFLVWRTHNLLKWPLRVAKVHASAWRKSNLSEAPGT